MGLPEIMIEFKTAASTAVSRSGNGVAALILRDTTSSANTLQSYSYTREAQVVKAHWTAANLDYINKTFLGNPSRVLVERIGGDDTYDAALGRLKSKKWNYLAIPDLADEDCNEIGEWIVAQRGDGKTFKAVLPNYAANHEGVINFATGDIKVDSKTYTASQYCPRIAGLIAGTPLDASCTYAALPEVDSITESIDPDGDVDAGKLILINDGTNIKIGRAINSLVTLNGNKTEDMQKVKIVDGMDLIRDDIRKAFEDNYIGIANSYDNKVLFVNAVNVYLSGLVRDGVLYDAYDNRAYIDVAAQRAWLEGKDPAYAEYGDEDIKKANTGSRVFAAAAVKFCDAIEDLVFAIYM